MEIFSRVAIVGVGLIGGSLGLCCRQHGIAGSVTGIGRSAERLQRGVTLGAIDSFSLSIKEGVRGCDLVVIATPVSLIEPMAREVALYADHEATVIDVGSVKGEMLRRLDKLFSGSCFIGCHPIAGKEESGVEAAESTLFEGTKTIITPVENCDKDRLEKVANLWEAVGSTVMMLDPDRHDEIFSIVSHLPHIIAFSLVNQIGAARQKEPDIINYSGGGLADYLRLGGSSPEMWRDIISLNRDNIIAAIDCFKNNLDELMSLVKSDAGDDMIEYFLRSNSVWKEIKQGFK